MRRLFLLILCACSSPQTKQTPPPLTPDAAVVVVPPEPDSKLVAYEKAKLEVKRLQTEADKDVLLAVWTGPYGGVPPWDKVKIEGFPGAFATALALLAAEVDLAPFAGELGGWFQDWAGLGLFARPA